MGMLFVFTSIGILLFIGAVAALIWSIRSGQLDDLDTPAMRLLVDDAAPAPVIAPAPLQTPLPVQQPDSSANAQPPRNP